MKIDRVEVLQRIERLLRHHRESEAVAEYEQLARDLPTDWTIGNGLGDLYLRIGQTDRAIRQFVQLAEQMSSDGAYARAGAVYRKVLKLQPDDEETRLRLAALAARQGFMAEARAHVQTIAANYRARHDDAGADRLLAQLEEVLSRSAKGTHLSRPGPMLPRRVREPRGEDSEAAPFPLTLGQAPVEPQDRERVGGGLDAQVPPAEQPARTLEEVFGAVREQALGQMVSEAVDAQFRLAQMYASAGLVDEALKAYEDAARAPHRRVEAALRIALLARTAGDERSSREWLCRAADWAGDMDQDCTVLYDLARELEASNDPVRALRIYERVRGLGGHSQDVTDRIARLRTREGGGSPSDR